jgi:hypothetical protein
MLLQSDSLEMHLEDAIMNTSAPYIQNTIELRPFCGAIIAGIRPSKIATTKISIFAKQYSS